MEPSRAAQVDIYRQQLGKKPATYWRFQVTSLKRGMIKILNQEIHYLLFNFYSLQFMTGNLTFI